MTPKRIALLIGVAALAGSGTYTLVYLYRWEWHRAILAGIFFVATEVALATAAMLHRLRAIEDRLAESTRPPAPGAPPPEVLARIEETGPTPRRPFAWLSPERTRMNVFLPFLLGAGVLASAVAWVVEAVARTTARPALERGLALRLAPLTLPAGGLLGVGPIRAPVVHRRRGALAGRIAIGLVVALVSVQVVDVLADATQGRTDPPSAAAMTTIELHLSGNRANADLGQATATLWASCAHVLRRDFPTPQVLVMDGGRAALILETPLGTHARRRVRGCLEDAIVDKIQASVQTISSIG